MSPNKKVEILQNLNPEDMSIVGKSISTLSRFANEKLPISSGFVITTIGFNSFLDFSELKKYYENSRKTDGDNVEHLERAFESVEYPNILSEEILKSYSKISGFTDAYVNLRAL